MSTFLWVIDLPYSIRNHHGGLLRYFNFSRELIAQGHKVVFAVVFDKDKALAMEWLEGLRADGIFTDYCEFRIDPRLERWSLGASLLLPFGMHVQRIQPYLKAMAATLEDLYRRFQAESVIISSTQCLFANYQVNGLPCIGDFSDSLALYCWRELKHAISEGRWRKAVSLFRQFTYYLFEEMYSSRTFKVCLLVSPVDQQIFDRIGIASRNVCIANGIRLPKTRGAVKKRYQLVFSGAMNFPPNYEGAIWFLKNVFPRVLAVEPSAQVVIAGAMPDPQLLEYAGPNISIPGFVEDLDLLIAESDLYVAPLVSGSGFKNKVAEAIINGTYVIGTTFSVEFLDPKIQELVVVRNEPEQMAKAILEYLREPEQFQPKAEQLREIFVCDYSWSAKATELAKLAETLKSAS